MLILLNKPYRVLSQFRSADGRATLKNFIDVPNVYAAGRLDYESEGLLLLTDDGRLQAHISQPKSGSRKRYWAQVEGVPTDTQLQQLVNGVDLRDGPAAALAASRIDPKNKVWKRAPPIRVRANIPDRWIELILSEGRNRQVRRMTAAVGLPTLRLIRTAVGPWTVDGLKPGDYRLLDNETAWQQIKRSNRQSA